MSGEGKGQQNSGNPEVTIEDGNDGRKNRGGCQGTRMKVLIGKGHGNAGHRKGEQHGDRGDCGPLRLKLREAAATDPPTTVEKQENGGELPEQYRPRQRQMAEADGIRDELIEDGDLKLEPEKFCIVRKQGGIQIALDCRKVEGIVFEAGMVAHDQEGQNGERSEERQIGDGGIAAVRYSGLRILRRS